MNDQNYEIENESLMELATVAMQVVIEAGDARITSENAIKELHSFNFDEAEKLITEAFAHLQKAHQAQTEVIQSEAAGKKYENSFLFNHAQDTLMTSMTQCNLTREIIELYKIMYHEIHNNK